MSRWNGNKFSIYKSEEKSTLGLIKELGEQTNFNTDELDNKTDLYGDHKGTWQGLKKPTLSEEGMRATVEKIINEEIPNIKKSLSKKQISLISDIDGTSYKKGDIVDIDFIKSEQIKNYSHQMRKMKTGSLTSIVCRGDSLTYGYDMNSEDKISPSNVLTDTGREHSRYRASKQYPQMLEEYLNNYGYKTSVLNLGYSGAWVKFSYDEYYKRRVDNLEIIMLGTNDSQLSSCPYVGDVKEFINYYEQLIIREVLWGNGLILMQPINTRNTKNMDIETFRTGIKLLGDKYNIPVIDGSDILNNYPYTIWSDNTHLNGVGYSILANGVASAIAMQDLTQPKNIFNGTLLLTRPTLDSCKYVNEEAIFFPASSGYTPNLVDEGRVACRLNKTGEIIYTFYNNVENMVLIPTIYMNKKAKVKFELNFGLPQPKTPLTTSLYKYAEFDGVFPSELIIENGDGGYTYSKVTVHKDYTNMHPLILANKGFYSLRVKNISDDLTEECTVNLFGIEFMTIESWYNLFNRSRYKRLFTNPDGVGTVETEIKLSESLNNFDVLAFHIHFFGYETRIVDFGTGSIQYLKTLNMSDDNTNTTTVLNEIRIEKIDEYTIKITMNKTVERDLNGNTSIKETESWLGKIRGINGIKY